MLLNAFIIALIVALIMTAIFVWGFKVRGVNSNALAFFFIVFLSSWAAGIWVRPLNYALPQNIPWLPQLIVGLITSLLMAWEVPSWSRRSMPEAVAVQSERRSPPVSMLTPAYWVALVALVIAIIVH